MKKTFIFLNWAIGGLQSSNNVSERGLQLHIWPSLEIDNFSNQGSNTVNIFKCIFWFNGFFLEGEKRDFLKDVGQDVTNGFKIASSLNKYFLSAHLLYSLCKKSP